MPSIGAGSVRVFVQVFKFLISIIKFMTKRVKSTKKISNGKMPVK